MKISIITCTYNSEKYLPICIKSVINQNLRPDVFEHIFVDGQSSDKTLQIIESYKKSNPQYTIKIMSKPPLGIYNAMNEGIRCASGEYITFINSDDYYVDNVLTKYIAFIKKTWKLDLYYWMNNMVDKDGVYKTCYPNRKLYKNWLSSFILWFACYVFQSNTFYKKELHTKYWFYNETYKLISDNEFFILLAKKRVSNVFYNQAIVNFRIHPESASANVKRQDTERIAMLKKHYAPLYTFFVTLVYKIYRKLRLN